MDQITLGGLFGVMVHLSFHTLAFTEVCEHMYNSCPCVWSNPL